jgi:hypothetical protein
MSKNKIYYYLDNPTDFANMTEHFDNSNSINDSAYNLVSGPVPITTPTLAFESIYTPVSAPIPPPIQREWYLNKLILKGKNSKKYWTLEVDELANSSLSAPAFNLLSAPISAPVYAPEYASISAPVYAPEYASISAPVYAPVYAPEYAPVYAPEYAPISAPVYAPEYAPIYAPAYAPEYAPISAPVPKKKRRNTKK